jgi:hypothetical protein
MLEESEVDQRDAEPTSDFDMLAYAGDYTPPEQYGHAQLADKVAAPSASRPTEPAFGLQRVQVVIRQASVPRQSEVPADADR